MHPCCRACAARGAVRACPPTGASDNVLRQYFVERCRQNLHVVMVMEQEGVALQRKVVAFPKMFHRCAYLRWPACLGRQRPVCLRGRLRWSRLSFCACRP